MKDSYRIIIAVVLSFLVLVAWQALVPKPEPAPKPAAKQQETGQATQTASQPAGAGQAQPAPASPTAPATQAATATPAAPAGPTPVQVATNAPEVVVDTPYIRAVFSSLGGTLKTVQLKDYYQDPGKQGGPFVLLDLPAGSPYSLGLDLPKNLKGLDQALFAADREKVEVRKGDQAQSLSFTLTASNYTITKTYTFVSNSYAFNLKVTVANATGQAVEIQPEVTLAELADQGDASRYSFHGMQALVDGHLVEQDPSDLADAEDTDNRAKGQKIDFVALSISYFIGAISPAQPYDESTTKPAIRGTVKDKTMLATLVTPLSRLESGQEKSWDFMVYYGPRDLDVLEPLGHGLAASVDFGWFDVIAKPMLMALNFFYSVIPNYGIAIIIVTILVKLLFWPLTRKSYKSMKEMQKLQPQVAKVREKYKDDKQRQQQEIMQLYKTYKVNPMGGCLPMIVQIPVFIAFYKVLGSAIELRHAPFMLWINDLSAPDRLFPDLGIPYVGGIPVMTLLMGASMFIQQKMTPTTGDPTQAKMMMLMPIVFTFMFISFPSGLVLYWLVNNVLSIGQQTFINKKG